MIKLNVGCGTDYREGYINIDGSSTLPRVDLVIDISKESLVSHFQESSVDHILANDIIEHHFHWQGVKIMEDFFKLLKSGGTVEIRVPDTIHLIRTWRYPIEKKVLFLYGGQDIPLGVDERMDESRRKHPEYFCHKYGWTRASMANALRDIGYKKIHTRRAGLNFVATAKKETS